MIWDPSSICAIKKIELIPNRIIRLIFYRYCDTERTELLGELGFASMSRCRTYFGLLPFTDRRVICRVMFFRGVLAGNTDCVSVLAGICFRVPGRQTRSSELFPDPDARNIDLELNRPVLKFYYNYLVQLIDIDLYFDKPSVIRDSLPKAFDVSSMGTGLSFPFCDLFVSVNIIRLRLLLISRKSF